MHDPVNFEETMFCSCGGGGGDGPSGGTYGAGAVRGAIGTANQIAGQMGRQGNPTDPQGTFGRPSFGEGDAYSGDGNYGDPDGR